MTQLDQERHVRQILDRHAHSRWSESTQIKLLVSILAGYCQPSAFESYLNAIVTEENRQAAALPPNPAVDSISARLDESFTENIKKRLAPIKTIAVSPVEGVISVDAFVDADSYRQITTWLSLEGLLAGFAEGEVIFGYLVNLDGLDIFVALTNSVHGPWIDTWIQSQEAGMEPSPPPLGSLEEPIVFERPGGQVVLRIIGAAS